MPVRRSCLPCLVAATLALTSFLAQRATRADEPPPQYVTTALSNASAPVVPLRGGYSLRRCLDLAEINYPKIAEARAQKDYYAAQLSEARTAPYSSWTVTSGIGPAPSVRGNSIYSPNTEVSLSSNLGLFWRVTLDGFVPLWTFGKISNLGDAAKAQVKVGEHMIQKERNQVRMDVRKAYFGLQFARSAGQLIDTAASALDAAIEKFQKQVDEGEGDELDLLKLKTFRAELEGRRSESSRYEAIALAGLRFLVGVKGHFDIDSNLLKVAKHKLGPVATYLSAARLYRPDLNMARAGVEARKAQVELAKAKLYPDVGLGLSGSWARAPEVADQLNPYTRDDANFFRYGFALGLRWSMDFLPASARIAQAQAQLEQTRAIERFALGGIGMEVETAYAEVQDAERREKAYGQAEAYAKRWMIQVQSGIDVGANEEKELVDPARQYALQRVSHLTAIMDLNVALSKLALVTGWETIAPDGT